MAIEVNFEQCGAYLLEICSGEFDLDDAKSSFTAAFEKARELGLCKILIDVREVTGNPSTVNRFELGKHAAELYAKHAPSLIIRGALVGREPLISADRFGGQVAQNRGMPNLVTTDYEEALRWLGVEAAMECGAA